jgi:predicted nucleic acid-binding protein
MVALSIYLDTSVLVPLFVSDAFVARARAFLGMQPSGLCVSDFGSAEFASVLGLRVRMNTLSIEDARAAVSHFDAWTSYTTARTGTTAADLQAGGAYLRRFDLPLRTPDAIHIAIAQRVGAELATFDQRMAQCARALGVAVVAI